LNQADALVFQTEKQLSEHGDKLPADKKAAIEEAVKELKEAHASKNIPAVESGLAKLQTVVQGMYEAMQQQQGGTNPGGNEQAKSGDSEVTDVDFEEVKDAK